MDKNNETNLMVEAIVSKLMSEKLTLDKSLILIEKAKKKAKLLNIDVTIAIVDDGGNLIASERMDNAILASISVAYSKAYTAIFLRTDTETASKNIVPGQDFYGLQNTHADKFCIFGGGIPIISNGKYIGAIGVSGGTVKEDTAIAKFALLD